MQNIDPIYFLEYALIIAFSFGIVAYWHRKRGLSKSVLLYSSMAYFGAVIAKIAFQAVSAAAVVNVFGYTSLASGLYFGLQTVLLEVGGAYLVARFALSRMRLVAVDAEGFGLSLAMWENGVFLGIFGILGLAADYVVLGLNTPVAQTVYSAINQSQPQLFSPIATALPFVVYGILERISSLLLHLAWGYLCVFAAVFHKRRYFLVALPMGLVDFLVPYEGTLGLPLFELLIFSIALLSLFVALSITKGSRQSVEEPKTAAPMAATSPSYGVSWKGRRDC